ncbi:MAG: HAD-IIIA family hydrolase [Desulfovibrionaceae bacterium]|nr:HAD-IIIA family hydrolase [Desulfovibrionaceae bacterium]
MRPREHRPRQAVILAGGRGTRLRPLTDSLPKPMIPFHGRPFLEYLVEQLKNQGFERVLMLLGYLPEKIREHFGDGSGFGLRVDYSVTAVDNDTGTRLRLARDLVDERFLLMYCDNYWPMDFDRMWAGYLDMGVPAQVVVYANKDGYTRDNLRVGPDNLVEVYDKTRTAEGLNGVDIGFVIMDRDLLGLIPEADVNFEAAVYPRLVADRGLAAYLTEHRYYSVGDQARLGLTEEFLRRRPAVILDRDGVLNVKPAKARYVTRPDEFVWLPGALEAVRLLKRAGYLVLVVSNQAGIARGEMTGQDLEAVHRAMRADLRAQDADVDAIYVCPHGWDEGCECRKPKPGMLFQAQREFCLDLSRTPFVGDDERDVQAGRSAGCPTYLVGGGKRLIDVVRSDILGPDAGSAGRSSL